MTHFILMCFYVKVWVDLNQIPSKSTITVALTSLQHQGQNSHGPLHPKIHIVCLAMTLT